MNSRSFVRGILTEVIERTISDYQEIYRSSKRRQVGCDAVYGPAFEIYDALPAEKREVFLATLRQAMVDAVSGVFAVIDGVHRLQDQEGGMVMQHGGDDLSGDLQDLFLEVVEH